MSEKHQAFPPGGYIVDELIERKMTVDDLARLSGIGAPRLRGVIAGTEPVTKLVAHGLSHAFGTGMDVWLNLEKRHRDDLEERSQ